MAENGKNNYMYNVFEISKSLQQLHHHQIQQQSQLLELYTARLDFRVRESAASNSSYGLLTIARVGVHGTP